AEAKPEKKAAEDKPKRTRTRKKKADGEDKSEAKAEAKSEEKAEAKAEPASKPGIETVVIDAEATADKPKKKGWWNIGG
ncbi:hypothetical protein ACFL12_08840, partial [Pseudomonadota bacterium]